MNFEILFFALRIYGAVASFAAALLIFRYGQSVSNPRFSRFVRTIWTFKAALGIQRAVSIYYLDFFAVFNSVQVVIATAIISTWLCVDVALQYYQLKRSRAKLHHSRDPISLANRAMDDLNFK